MRRLICDVYKFPNPVFINSAREFILPDASRAILFTPDCDFVGKDLLCVCPVIALFSGTKYMCERARASEIRRHLRLNGRRQEMCILEIIFVEAVGRNAPHRPSQTHV